MKIKLVALFFVLNCLSSLSHGANYYSQPVTGEVESIEVNSPFTSGRNIIVVIRDSNGGIPLCGGNSPSGYINKADNPDTYSSLLSLLLSAKATKNQVQVLTADGPEGCRIDRVHLKYN